MIIKKIFLLATSIISLLIFIFFFTINSNAEANNSKRYSKDEGVLSIMYHRFNELKYPSTNIRMEIFRKHIKLIENSKKELDANYDGFVKSIEGDLQSFKKKMLLVYSI